MAFIREGAKVSYVGYPDQGLTVGDQGQVIASASDRSSHVRWTTGESSGQVTLALNDDLVQIVAQREDDIDFASGSLVSLAVRDIYDEQGEVGLVNALAEAGHLTALSQIAAEASEWVQARVASDPSVADALVHLDATEQGEVLSYLTAALLRDAFGRES